MKRLCLAVLTIMTPPVAQAQPEEPGPYLAGWTAEALQRSGRSLSCRIYYPAAVEGNEAPVDTLHRPYPIVALGHGFFMQTGYYLSHFWHLATHGFVVIAPQFPDANHGELAEDLLFCIDYLRSEHGRVGSRFRGHLDTAHVGLSGHSMGGGASLLAASRDGRVDVVAPLAAAETNPSAIAAMPLIQGVVYLISGASDGITPPASHQLPMYNNAHPLKGLPLIQQANHTRFMDVATFDWTDPNGSLTRPEQLRITRRYLTAVFRLILKGDPTYWSYAFGDSALADPAIVLSRGLRPLTPLPFAQVSPSGSVADPPVTFRWRRATALDPSQAVQYRIAFQPLYPSPLPAFGIGPLSDTTWTALDELRRATRYRWRVFASTSDSTERASQAAMDFTLLCRPPTRRAHLVVKNALGDSDTLWFGYDSSATCGEDGELCEIAVVEPCGPPGNWFCTWWDDWCNPVQSALIMHDYRAASVAAIPDTHLLAFQAGDNGFPVSLCWTSADVRAVCDSALLTDRFGGLIYRARMDLMDSLLITAALPLDVFYLIRYGQKFSPTDCTEPQVRYHLAFGDNGLGRDTLWWAVGQGATCGLDTALCEGGWEEPPPPPAGVFDVRYTGGTCTTGTHRAYLPEACGGVDTVGISLQPGASGFPISVRWDSVDVPAGQLDSVILVDRFGGFLFRTAIRGTGEAQIANPVVTNLSLLLFRTFLPVEEPHHTVSEFALSQNYPNPFNSISNIEMRIGKWGLVDLAVFDLLGRRVATLVNEPRAPGVYAVRWDARGLSGGAYVYRLVAGGYTAARLMILLK